MSFRRTIAVVALAVLVVSCSGGDDDEGAAGSTTSASPTTVESTTTTAPPTAPLTGLPVGDPAILARPALVVKIDNADGSGSRARPQLGLNQADVVYEEMVEGSVTRFAAIFQSQGSDPVGPIRSARTTDVALVSPLNHPLYAWSGANEDFTVIIRNAPIVDVGYEVATSAYARRNETGHVAPHNLYSTTSALFALAPAGALPPPALFTYRGAGEAPSQASRPVASVHVMFGTGPGSAPVDWTYDPAGDRFLRNQRGTPHVDEAGVQIAPRNVVIQFVGYHNVGFDSVGSPIPEAELVGQGSCWIMTGGVLVEGTWSKPTPDAVTTYTDSTGAAIGLTPGQTWVELTPAGGATIVG